MGESTYSKYLRLFGNIFLMFIGFIVFVILTILLFRALFGVLHYMPWLSIVYMVFILLVPLCIFGTAYIIFIKRTKYHPSKTIRAISYGLFIIALLAWAAALVMDVQIFYTYQYGSIDKYYSYNLLFLFLNVLCIFGVGILQALSLPPEKDWMEKHIQKP